MSVHAESRRGCRVFPSCSLTYGISPGVLPFGWPSGSWIGLSSKILGNFGSTDMGPCIGIFLSAD